ncbi:hypothetical protein [Kitasatospora purpeofusca]|uniref:hypothetical protein n=1 Tax=Kitasatospora purpeofusca TaxID=67352 RepID=UPI002A5AA6EC|nr:hypothetical protein [Kitasatospora purpeofusca]MDY0811376.1 hypothetical protein [Kitasatospora purpeofusca]
MADEDVQQEDPRDEDGNDRAAGAGAVPPADRSYGDRASDHADPADGPDPGRPDNGPVRQDYDATAESTAAAADPRTPYVPPPKDEADRDEADRDEADRDGAERDEAAGTGQGGDPQRSG